MRQKQNKPVFDQICALDNLFSAWKKIEREFSFHDVWYDELSFKSFKFNLRTELKKIQKELAGGTYRLQDIIPIPFPKKGPGTIRQAFRIAVRDQVVWVAVCNILGPMAEPKMPAWSFGNRLYIPMWKIRKSNPNQSISDEITDGPDYVWKNGKFINSSFRLYMPWNRSWPRFRHLLTATLKKMARVPLEVSEGEYLDSYSEVDEWMRLRYLNPGYFSLPDSKNQDETGLKNDGDGRKTRKKRRIFWASIDISRFYPHIKMSALPEALIRHCNLAHVNEDTGEVVRDADPRIRNLLTALTSFRIGGNDALTKEELACMNLEADKLEDYDGLPTGLLVGGWLANVYLLDIDLRISGRLEKERHIAHFRYVDDHTFVSTSPQKLIEWIRAYRDELDDIGLTISEHKFTPNPVVDSYGKYKKEHGGDTSADDDGKTQPYISLAEIVLAKEWPDEFPDILNQAPGSFLDEFNYYLSRITEKCEIDPLFPTPLMTQTLGKISQIGALDLALLSRHETRMVEHDLKTLIVADLPEEEIKEDTRVSFASTFLSRIIISSAMDYDKLHTLRHEWIEKCNALKSHLRDALLLPHAPENKESNEKVTTEIQHNIDSLVSQVFDIPDCHVPGWKMNGFSYPYPEKFEPHDDMTKIQKEANQIAADINSLYENTARKIMAESERVFNLLMKAACKVPDKLKIWIRITEFCMIHLPSKLPEIISGINKHSGVHLHEKECSFITSQLFSVVANRLVGLCWDAYLKASETGTDSISVKAMFGKINEITNLNTPENMPEYCQASVKLYEMAVNFAHYIEAAAHDSELRYYPHPENEDDTIFEILWILDGLPFERQKSFNILSVIDSGYIFQSIGAPAGYHLLTKLITSRAEYDGQQREEIEEILMKYPEPELADIWSQRTPHRKEAEDAPESDSGYIPVEALISAYRDPTASSPANPYATYISSEIVCLKILQAAIDRFTTVNEDEIIPEERINIQDILVNKEDLGTLWKSQDPSECEIRVRFATGAEPDITLLTETITNSRAKILYLFGVMLYELLAKETDIEWLKYRPEYFFEWPSIIRKLHSDGKIGSFCERLLSGCLLPTTRELLDMHVTSESVDDVHYFYAPLFIPHIQYMNEMIEEYFDTLKMGVTRIEGDHRIELKFIDLK